MSRVPDDPGNYFQTSSSLATSERKATKAKNKYGDPIKFPSKILAVTADPDVERVLYVAEAAGEVKRVDLDTGEVRKVFNQATAPVTCLAICSETRTFFAGSWDKRIYVIDFRNGKCKRQLQGHSDFVKCLTATSLNGKRILISGGADAAIVVWNVETGKQLYKLKGHTKALQDLAIDPLSIPEGTTEPGDTFTLFSASSDREIRRWHISLDSAYELPESVESTILAHDTSVYKLYFDSEGDLWTASADKTAKHLVRSRGWEADTVLQHPDFVRDVAISERLGLVVTACRDEEVRVWDAASGDLMCTYSGHYEEVTGLIVVGSMVVSVSIDGTLRKWGLGKDAMENYRKEIEDVEKGEEKESVKDGATGGMLTAEEEAELADLMDDDTD